MTADTVGGVFGYAVELARALGVRGAEVFLATKGGQLSEDQRAEVRAVPGLHVLEAEGSEDRLEWMEDPWEDVARSSRRLLALERELHPDVVHLNDYAHGALPFAAPVLVVGHSCVLSWYEAVRGGPPPPSFDRYREEVARGLAAAALVVAPTQAMLGALARQHGPLRTARVIPNGRPASLFRPLAKEPLVLCAGRLWDEAKNAAALDAVAPELPWPVLLAGEAAHPDPAHSGSPADADAHRPGRARPLGRLSREAMSSALGRASIYALPARYEPFGLSVLEAALCACALVLGDISSLRENWDGAALFVDPGSDAALADAITRLAGDGELRNRLSAEARRRALRLTPERMAAAYLEAYVELSAARRCR